MKTPALGATNTYSYLTRRYMFALSMIALITLVHLGLRELHHNRHVEFAHTMEMANREMRLMQRGSIIASLWMLGNSPDEVARGRFEFERVTKELEATMATPDAQRMPAVYKEELESHVQYMHRLLGYAGGSIHDQNYLDLQARIEGPWMEQMRAQITEYEAEGMRVLNRLINAERVLVLVTLALLGALGVFVFRPMVNAVMQSQSYLEHLSRLKSEFLANMSHEIRTPINAIFGIGELLLQSDITPKQRSQVETLMGSADGLLSIIDDILDFSKIEAGRLDIESVPFDLHSAAEDVAELLATRAREKRLEIIVRYMPGTPQYVIGDPGRVRQVLINLVGNAIKFTESGYVMVTVEAVDAADMQSVEVMMRVKVEDTGIGIARDQIDHIFDMFSQGDGSATRRYGGTGLGLTISRQLSNLMGGRIGVESEEGKGSIFWFTMRMRRVDRPGRFEPSHGVLANKRVLVVDDIEANRELLVDSLQREGIEVLAVDGGKKALRELRQASESGRPYDLALLDYMMPEMNGETLIRAIRNDAAVGATPIIVLSSAEEKGFLKTFASMNVAAYLSKPARRNQLLDMMAMVLEARARGQAFEMLTVHATEAMRTKAVFEQSRPLKGIRILLTEDNRINREFTTEMLEVMGCHVDHAENGKIAVEKCQQQPYDIILMDCQMPVMDGFEAAQTIQTLKGRGVLPDIPIIALTANAMEGDRERCLRSGMHDYLSKPVRRAKLEAMLLRWLKNIQAPMPLPTMPEVVLPSLSATLPKLVVPEGVDRLAFDETRQLVGAKIGTIIDYYREDAAQYYEEIRRCVEEGEAMERCVAPAHTLKSSARQFGLIAVSDYARQIEEIGRKGSTGSEARDKVASLLVPLADALAQGETFLAAARLEVA